MLTSIKDRSVVVTGGSKGIGKGIAQVFAAQGAKVMIGSRGEKDGNAAVEELRASGGTAEFFQCDVSEWDSVKNLINHTVEAFGGLHVVCANAGAFPQTKMVEHGSQRVGSGNGYKFKKRIFMCKSFYTRI